MFPNFIPFNASRAAKPSLHRLLLRTKVQDLKPEEQVQMEPTDRPWAQPGRISHVHSLTQFYR